jgi:uncharacterized protein YcbK (DUF882 family)
MRIYREAYSFILFLLVFFLVTFAPGALSAAQVQPSERYFLSGDGLLQLSNAKNGKSGKIRYRLPDGSYPQAAQQKIDRIFGISVSSDENISLRFISFLDYFEDRFQRSIRIISGYRSPAYNASLRKRGALAAKTSLHMEGMAADIQVGKRIGAQAFEMIKELDCCGVGYYHGSSLHVDTGPARYWDETSSQVQTDISDHNKRIMARTDKDIYLPGETIQLRLARITDYPLGVVSGFAIVRNEHVLQEFSLSGNRDACLAIRDPRDKIMRWTIPEDFQANEKVQIQLRFCDKPFPEMLDQIESNPIVIQ